jgi:hypothetical protein
LAATAQAIMPSEGVAAEMHSKRGKSEGKHQICFCRLPARRSTVSRSSSSCRQPEGTAEIVVILLMQIVRENEPLMIKVDLK